MYNSFLYTCNQELTKGKTFTYTGFFWLQQYWNIIDHEPQCCVIHKLVYMYVERSHYLIWATMNQTKINVHVTDY